MSTGVTVLGSTGSIGISSLDVIARHPDRYHVESLSAKSNVDLMLLQCQQHSPKRVVMVDSLSAKRLREKLNEINSPIEVMDGQQKLSELARQGGDTVICGIVGAAGLLSTLAAVKAGKKVLIANKEPLVMLGKHIMNLGKTHGACLLPLDSEHNAIFQCLPHLVMNSGLPATKFATNSGVEKILLTGSGGPFRTTPMAEFRNITPDQACNHPNWKMGRKISVDSATMMNKGLELIEACVLFGVEHQSIEIVIHPQSVIHSMVEYIDGSVIAQLGSADMRVPIANALAWPERIRSGASSLNLLDCQRFDFEAPDLTRFPALRLARQVAEQKGNAPTVMNAANEVAVDAFLKRQITFDRIVDVVERAMDNMDYQRNVDLESVLETDQRTRTYCTALL
ncbi:MAG: 1-deoxy-D-xylulose-5-phosphate reductoisomerase [Gammaproteobacteria bacterium]|nr:1-deoxy-D-xylulose-5-phosphate reductoisomerase [Gammaproteobacteria bacterium]